MSKHPSRIRVAELEYATGIRTEKPQWQLHDCPKRRCIGLEIIQGESAYCSCWLEDGKCPAKQRLVRGATDPYPALGGLVYSLVILCFVIWMFGLTALVYLGVR